MRPLSKETIMSKVDAPVKAAAKTIDGLKVARDILVAVAPTVIATAAAVYIAKKLQD
jgi:hypothetical protein